VVLNGDANVIIGVLPQDFHFAPAEPAEFWSTIHASSECDLRRSCHSLYGVARLKDGVSLSTALANLTSIAAQLEKLYPGDNSGQSAAVITLTESIVGDIRPILFVLLCGAGLLLLIASVNVASLLLVRSESRKREVAVRTALGASRVRLTRQFVGKSLYLLLHVDLGLRPDHLATLWIAAPMSNYGKDPQAIALERRVLSQIAALPGVKSVGITTDIPVTHWGDTTWLRILGRPWHGEHNDAPECDVNPEYFTTLGAKLLRGRYFVEGEDASKPHVVIINQAFAKEYFPGEDPIGRQISHVSVAPDPMEIDGIVEDIKEGQLDTVNRATVYIPFEQSPGNYFNVVVRTSQAEQSLLPVMRAAIHQIDPDIVAAEGATMMEVINDSQSAYLHRSSAWLVGGFAFLALLLGVVGLYGVVAYSVSQRTREIGIRMALGAQSRSVYQLILKEAARLIAIGLAAGLV